MPVQRTIIQSLPHAGLPGWECRVMLLEVSPGCRVPPHQHPTSGIVYVLEGAIISQFEGEQAETFTAGQSFIEHGLKLHTRAENASSSENLRLLVSYVIENGGIYTLMKED